VLLHTFGNFHVRMKRVIMYAFTQFLCLFVLLWSVAMTAKRGMIQTCPIPAAGCKAASRATTFQVQP